MNENAFINKIKDYLDIEDESKDFISCEEKVKELCVAKLCNVLGLKRTYNYKNEMFKLFSCVMAEALCEKFKFSKHIADDCIRLVKYNGVNFVDKAKQFLDMEDIDEATLDIFNFVDKNKSLIIKSL